MQLLSKCIDLDVPYAWSREGSDWVAENGHRLVRKGSLWTLQRGNDVIAVCYTAALHPATIPRHDAWVDARTGSPFFLVFEHVSLESSVDAPLTMEDLGYDFFVAKKVSHVIFFVCPLTGKVQHSGAKDKNGLGPGKRYCSVCKTMVSANNFVSQHWKVHPSAPLRGVVTCDDICSLIR